MKEASQTTKTEEPDFDCYTANFSIPAKGECINCSYYSKCRELFDIEIEEEELCKEIDEE